MQAPPTPLEQMRAELRRQQEGYRSELPARLAQLEGFWRDAHAGAAAGPGALDGLRRAAHTMHGTAGTFGLRELSVACAVLESATEGLLAQPDGDGMAALQHAFDGVRRCILAACDGGRA